MLSRRVFLLRANVLVALASVSNGQQQCTICRDGSPITNRDGEIGMTNPLPVPNCGALDDITHFLAADSIECESVRAISSICGCAIEEDACHVCGEGVKQNNPNFILDHVFDKGLISGDLSTPGGIDFDCRIAEAYMYGFNKQDELCSTVKQGVEQYCCSNATAGAEAPEPLAPNCKACHPYGFLNDTKLIEIHNNSFTCQEASDHFYDETDECWLIEDLCECQPHCTLCRSGEPVPLPENPLSSKALGLPGNFTNCRGLNDFLLPIRNDSDVCLASHLFGSLCGCEERQKSCRICEDGQQISETMSTKWRFLRGNVKSVLPDYLQRFAFPDTFDCATYQSVQAQLYEEDDMYCYIAKFKADACGCRNDHIVAMVWTQRVASTISALSSLYIVLDIIFLPSTRTFYHELMVGLSVSDFSRAASMAFSTLLMPADSASYKARGSEFTCKLQAFFIQLGFTATFYNVALALLFLFLVQFPRRVFQKPHNVYLHGCLVAVGLALACAGIPFYDIGLTGCQLVPPPVAYTWVPITVIFTVPLTLATVGVTVLVIWLGCLAVSPKERQVFRQSCCYGIIFWIIWPPQLMVYLLSLDEDYLPLYVLAFLISNSQGTLNMLVYGWVRRCGPQQGRAQHPAFSCSTSQTMQEGRKSLDEEPVSKIEKLEVGGGDLHDRDAEPSC